jgi:hypothetical protein
LFAAVTPRHAACFSMPLLMPFRHRRFSYLRRRHDFDYATFTPLIIFATLIIRRHYAAADISPGFFAISPMPPYHYAAAVIRRFRRRRRRC